MPAPVEDVVAADPDDPRGSSFNSSVLPLLIVGIVTGVLVALVIGKGVAQIPSLLVASALAGLAAIAIVQCWLDVIEGPWLHNAGVMALLVLAVASAVTGCVAWMGPPGIAVAAVVVVLVGNPWSGITSAPELLPRIAGDVGQLLPPGAAGTALRGTAFFDGARSGGPVAVLVLWSLLGLIATGLGSTRRPVT